MASGKDYLEFILDQLSGSEEVSYRAMMGEYILYFRGKVIGGILVEDVDDSEFLQELVRSVYEDLPAPKKK